MLEITFVDSPSVEVKGVVSFEFRDGILYLYGKGEPLPLAAFTQVNVLGVRFV